MEYKIIIRQFIGVPNQVVSKNEVFLGLINLEIEGILTLTGFGIYKNFQSGKLRFTTSAKKLNDGSLIFHYSILDSELREAIQKSIESYLDKTYFVFKTKEDSA